MDAKRNGLRDYVKANRRASREAEIENHARPVSFSRVHKSKKVYDRKKLKADDKRHLPSSFPYANRQAGIHEHQIVGRVHGEPLICAPGAAKYLEKSFRGYLSGAGTLCAMSVSAAYRPGPAIYINTKTDR